MRCAAIAAVLASMHCASVAEGRLFYQTYGAAVAAPGGSCAWNVNQDYFVPRHCDSGRYGLFSSCKTSHTSSAACRRGHPIYHGYCSPFGACHYLWRNHVYKAHCSACGLATCSACGLATHVAANSPSHHTVHVPGAATLEPFGIEVLGTIRVDSDDAVASVSDTVAAHESAHGGYEELRLPSLGKPPEDATAPPSATQSPEPAL